MTLTKTQAIVTIAAGSTVLLAFIFAGMLWAAEHHFETVAAHEHSMQLAANSFDQALKNNQRTIIKREVRRLKYKQQKGTITDQELYDLQGLLQELEDLQ